IRSRGSLGEHHAALKVKLTACDSCVHQPDEALSVETRPGITDHQDDQLLGAGNVIGLCMIADPGRLVEWPVNGIMPGGAVLASDPNAPRTEDSLRFKEISPSVN